MSFNYRPAYTGGCMTAINWLSFFQHLVPIALLAIANMIHTVHIVRLKHRITRLENVNATKDWIKAIEDGESLSDLSYMKQDGFLK